MKQLALRRVPVSRSEKGKLEIVHRLPGFRAFSKTDRIVRAPVDFTRVFFFLKKSCLFFSVFIARLYRGLKIPV